MPGDGDGFVVDDRGRAYWGRHGAAGLLLRGHLDGRPVVLLQHRAPWSHQGGTWALPGGARDRDESVAAAAAREAHEEAGLTGAQIEFIGLEIVTAEVEATDIATGRAVVWTYITVVAEAVVSDDGALPKLEPNRESKELAWVPEDDVAGMDLHPGFAASWENVRAKLAGLDAKAAELGLSRVEYRRRRSAQDARTTQMPVSSADLQRLGHDFADLADKDAMGDAWP